ncbi:MAG: hypothetical protein MZV70_65710 [Desulfobacterales bacterium]|nr:hypothetical protein [Desulfobacterales bacterium]
MATADIRGPSKLEGTVHVNVQLIRKFMKNYFFNPADYTPVAPDFSRARMTCSSSTRGRPRAWGLCSSTTTSRFLKPTSKLPNVAIFIKQIESVQGAAGKSRAGQGSGYGPVFFSARWARCSPSWSMAS